MAINRVSGQKRAISFDRSMLSDGILLFALSLIVWGIKEKTLVLFNHEIYTVPDWSYSIFGTFAVILSILLLIAVFIKPLSTIMDNVIKGPFGIIYWTYFWLVYTFSWIKSLAIIPQETFAYYLLASMGIVWFVIIIVVCIKAYIKFVNWLRTFHYGSVAK